MVAPVGRGGQLRRQVHRLGQQEPNQQDGAKTGRCKRQERDWQAR
jgi:hypothetical protein